MTAAPSQSSSGSPEARQFRQLLIHTICPHIKQWSDAEDVPQFGCEKCPATVETSQGTGVQMCRLNAEKAADAVLGILDVAQAWPIRGAMPCRDTARTDAVVCNPFANEPPASPPTALPAGAWQPADSTPPVSAGQMKEFIVAVYRPKTGKVYTFGCMYLNEHRIQYEYCPKKDDPGFCDDCEDGCKTTGWFYLVGDDNNESGCYQPIWLSEGAKLIGWQDLPQWDGALPSTDREGGK